MKGKPEAVNWRPFRVTSTDPRADVTISLPFVPRPADADFESTPEPDPKSPDDVSPENDSPDPEPASAEPDSASDPLAVVAAAEPFWPECAVNDALRKGTDASRWMDDALSPPGVVGLVVLTVMDALDRIKDMFGEGSKSRWNAARGAWQRISSSEYLVASTTSARADHCSPLSAVLFRCPIAKEHSVCVPTTSKFEPRSVTVVPPLELPLEGKIDESAGGGK
jgi:hypothetical protein